MVGDGIGNLSSLTYLRLYLVNIQVEDGVLDEIVNLKCYWWLRRIKYCR